VPRSCGFVVVCRAVVGLTSCWPEKAQIRSLVICYPASSSWQTMGTETLGTSSTRSATRTLNANTHTTRGTSEPWPDMSTSTTCSRGSYARRTDSDTAEICTSYACTPLPTSSTARYDKNPGHFQQQWFNKRCYAFPYAPGRECDWKVTVSRAASPT